ncbi:unnamed protein product [Rotaria sordida]|uniref:UDENN domain-containing protein n=1 Tax=Rotaria sordida TaxID=392033 RepID=A0A815KPA3_9BILA|nr:unnamed protein product [Rotaria sordida]CAF3487672.1 unnamed protein product [Rotaria sordida]
MPLLNSFVDSIVCVGFTSERGLKLDPESKDNGSLFKSSLQSSVLAIVTADRAIYPQARGSEFIDSCYPPICYTRSHSFTASSISSGRSTPVSSLANGVRTQKQHIIPAVYNNLPLFCFSDGVRITYEREDESIHHIVFTQEEGKRIYALALTFQQSFCLKTDKPDDEGTYQIEDVKLSTSNTRQSSLSKIPVPIERQKQASSPTTVKTRSKQIPSSFNYSNPNSTSQPRSSSNSNNSTKQPRYVSHTISSYMKNLSSTATPPPTRMIRTNSQNSLSSLNETSSSLSSTTTEVRRRSTSNTSRTLSTNITSPDTTKPFYLPHCIVLVSNQPYWTAMQETISIIHDEIIRSKIEPSANTYKQLIQKYAFLACNTPIPPIPWERFSLSFNLTYDQSVLTFDSPIDTNHPVLDLDLSILLLTLNIGKLLDVLAAIFTQQPIIFFSSNYSTLVTTLECLLYLIYPLKWAHVYVPFVPDGLCDLYLEDPPGSYIMGAHSRHQTIVEDLDISFTCNLDNDRNIYVPKKMEFYHLPPSKLQRFVGRITEFVENIKVSRSLQNVHTPIRLRIDQQREYERQQRTETNHKIIKIFLDLMVDLYGDTLKPIYWKVNSQQLSPTNTLTRTSSIGSKNSNQNQTKTTFSKEKYLLSKTKGFELEFYRAFTESTAFQHLIEEEITSTSPTVFKQICELHSLSNEKQLYHVNNISSEENEHNQIESTTTLYDLYSSQMLLPLPYWPSNTSTHYLDSCIELFTSELENAQKERSPVVITVYAYLRGCALLARGQYLDGLRDLYLIENPNLFPYDYIDRIILPRLSEECLLELFLNEPYYTKSPEWKKVNIHSISQNMTIIDLEKSGNSLDDATPVQSATEVDLNNEWDHSENALTLEQFSELVHRLSIVLDKETTEKLFNALLYWTDNSIAKTLKKDKTLTNKSSETMKPLARSWSITTNTLKDTFSMLNDYRRGNQNATLSSKSSIESNPGLPATLFESFLDIWQQTNAEKVRMNRYLPGDRQNKESILKISSSGIVSKSDGPGRLILTQKRLYFLPEARSFAHLLTELMYIESVDKYQYQTVFSSSKPGIKIQTSSKKSSLPRDNNLTVKSKTSSLEKESQSLIRLIFKNNHEQELWYIIIMELWSGLTIAHEQCDTAVLNKASRHIALMDTLSNIDYDEETMPLGDKPLTSSREKPKQRHNEASLEMALNDLSTFTRMRQDGSFKSLSVETRNVLTRRLSPSINETERHAVHCLIFTEHPDHGRSSLWCAYGSKLKVFNVTTWICDPSDILFPSLITCMCLDTRDKLWVGCIHGQLFVVDTLTHVCGSQIASIDGEGGCQTIAFDIIHNHILAANRAGLVTVWNASNWEYINDFNIYEIYKTTQNIQQRPFKSEAVITFRNPSKLSKTVQNRIQQLNADSKESTKQIDIPNAPSPSGPASIIPLSTDKLERIQIYGDLLFACYRYDYILILCISDSNTYTFEHLISVKYKTGDSTPIDSFIVYNKQLWVSSGCIIYIFNVNNTNDENSYNLLMKKPVDDDRLITMLGFSGHIWAGSLHGNVYIYRMDNYELHKTFAGHSDGVCSLCSMLDMYVISGSLQNDTSIAIWENIQPSNNETNALISSLRTKEVMKPIDIL